MALVELRKGEVLSLVMTSAGAGKSLSLRVGWKGLLSAIARAIILARQDPIRILGARPMWRTHEVCS
jgi:hypothetical protein